MTAAARRPIAARQLGAVQHAAAWLVGRGASANAISVAGMAAALAAGACFALVPALPGGARLLWLAGAALVQARLLANLLDGMVAIGRGIASPVGELFNEVPDRVSDTAVLAGLGWAAGSPRAGAGRGAGGDGDGLRPRRRLRRRGAERLPWADGQAAPHGAGDGGGAVVRGGARRLVAARAPRRIMAGGCGRGFDGRAPAGRHRPGAAAMTVPVV